MRILHLLSSTGFHGAETMAAELIRQSTALGLECHLGVFDNGGRGDRRALEEVQDCCKGVWVVPGHRRVDFAAVRAIAGYAHRHRIDLVHSHKYKTTLHALLARRFAAFKLLSTYHNWLTDTRSLALYAALDKRLARFCDAAVGVSSLVVEELARFVAQKKLSHIGNGVDPERFSAAIDKRTAREAIGLGQRPVIGFVGRLSAQKGVDDLLDALAAVRNRLDVDLLIVGDGEHRRALEQRAHALGVAAHTHFLGNRADTPLLYRAMDLFVLPSYVEAYPMVVLEAMACERPVLATRVGDVPRIVAHGQTGWIVEAGAPTKLAAAIVEALSDSSVLGRMGAKAREIVMSRHTAHAMAEQYALRYRLLLPRA